MTKQLKTAAVFGAAILALGAAGTAAAQSTVRRTSDNVRSITKVASRNHIETGIGSATNNRYSISSRDRTGRLASPAHDRNAVDTVPNPRRNVWGASDMHRDAASIARRLGPNSTAIVERPSSPISGHRYDQHTTYKVVPPLRGVQVNSYRVPQRATAPHIHVQGNYPRYVPPPSRSRAPVYRSYSSSSSVRYYGSHSYGSSSGSRGSR